MSEIRVHIIRAILKHGLHKKNNTVTKHDIELKKALENLLKYLNEQTS